MIKRIMKTEEDFFDNCDYAYKVIDFVDDIESDARWWFEVAYYNQNDQSYSVIFTSFETEEYKDYVLSVKAIRINEELEISLVKKVDNLVK